MISRRQLLQSLIGGGVASTLPRFSYASGDDESLFLFIFCAGGWDQHAVFAPLFDATQIDMEQDAIASQLYDIPFVDHESRPNVRSFLEQYGEDVCFLNGFEVRSIAHERCTEILLAGDSSAPIGDWPTLLAINSTVPRLTPHVLVSGPVMSGAHNASVVRIGNANQLPSLLNGNVLTQSSPQLVVPPSTSASRVDEYLANRLRDEHPQYKAALESANTLKEYQDIFPTEIPTNEIAYDLNQQLDVALTCLELGLSRCTTVQYDGIWGIGWDSHANIEYQQLHFDSLFGYLLQLKADLEQRTDALGRPLSSRVNVVVYSEMGRHPQYNEWNGRHHWTATSALAWGPNVKGGRAIGSYNSDGLGQKVDLSSGEVDSSGTAMRSVHLGATLLAMGDVDPALYLPGVTPISAMIR